jgi:GR25 family glycosyltransferase involved in LPS biosynthesis
MVKYFAINLRERPDRLLHLEGEFKMANIEVKVIEAVNGYDESLQNFKIGDFAHEREYACFLSHLKVLKEAHDTIEITEKFVVIFEDDVVLINDFEKELLFSLEKVPENFTFFRLGYFTYRSGRDKAIENNKYWYQRNPVYGLHSYAVRRSSLPKIIAHLENCSEAIDSYLSKTFWRETAVHYKPLAYQLLKSGSDVGNPDSVSLTPFKLKRIWPPLFSSQTEIPKVLHVLPGQRIFNVPKGWTIRNWFFTDEIHEFRRFGFQIPFFYWVLYLYGGLVFYDEIPCRLKLGAPDINGDYGYCEAGNKDLLKLMYEYVVAFDKTVKLPDNSPYLGPAPGFY